MQNTDKELLELAAKAAGIHLEWDGPPDLWHPMYYQGKTYHGWNPLDDDGAALRLAVKLRLEIINDGYMVIARTRNPHQFGAQQSLGPVEDSCVATRLAIVRAAAEIGKNMK